MARIQIQTKKDEIYVSKEIEDKDVAALRAECKGLPNYESYSMMCVETDGREVIHTWRAEDIFRMSILL
jgi:hypothetical protein